MAGQFGLRFRLLRKLQGSFTCRNSATDSFTSPPKEGMLWIFCQKNLMALGLNLRSWAQEASMLTTRPLKPPAVRLLGVLCMECLKWRLSSGPYACWICRTTEGILIKFGVIGWSKIISLITFVWYLSSITWISLGAPIDFYQFSKIWLTLQNNCEWCKSNWMGGGCWLWGLSYLAVRSLTRRRKINL
jgi:hypothetical protein